MSEESNRSSWTRGGNNPRPQRSSRSVPPPRPEEIESEQRQAITNSFSSPELSYNGSDMIVSTPLGEEYKGVWKRMIRKNFMNQHQMRRFITSCFVDAEGAGHVDVLVEGLGSSDGLNRIREIVTSSVSVDAGNQAKTTSFQRVILPFLALLIRRRVVDCVLEREINAIYSAVYNNLDPFMNDVVMSMLQELVRRRDISDQKTNQNELLADDPSAFIPTSLGQFFLVIAQLINEFLKRIKSASSNKTMHQIAEKLEKLKIEWHESFQQAITSDPLTSGTESREYFFIILDKEIDRMNRMLRKNKDLQPQKNRKVSSNEDIEHYRNLSRLADLQRTYDPPGNLSPKGKRHDNDFSEISKISIIPTKEEALCEREPFLPTIYEDDDLHHLPKGAARLLDRQFRLLREDMFNSFRLNIKSFISFLSEVNKNDAQVQQMQKLKAQGGRYRNQGDNGDLYVYTNVEFSEIGIDKRIGIFCRVAFTPPNTRKTVRERRIYWEKAKRLMSGNLVCLLCPNEDIRNNKKKTISAAEYSLYFGTVARRDENMLAEKKGARIDINFMDISVYSIATKDISRKHVSNRMVKHCFMIESTDLLFESYNNILKTLQEARPEIFPFEKYLTPQVDGDISNMTFNVCPPTYSIAPGFKFDLSVLLNHDKNRKLYLYAKDMQSRNSAIRDLKAYSTLDETQAEALVSALCREVALIEGPPGTGKTYIGVQIMRVLLAERNHQFNRIGPILTNRRINRMGPILTITYTNHALDSFLQDLLDCGIENIVRMGSRSKSDTIMELQIDRICRKRDNTVPKPRELGEAYRELEQIEERMKEIAKSQNHKWINWNYQPVTLYLRSKFPKHYKNLEKPNIPNALFDMEDSESEWQNVRGRNNRKKSIFEQWVHGEDLQTARRLRELFFNQTNELNGNNEGNENVYDALSEYSNDDGTHDFDDDVDYEFTNWLRSWKMPTSERGLEELKGDHDVWGMSRKERVILHNFWREELLLRSVEKLEKIKKDYDEARNKIDAIHSEVRRDVLRESDVIGVTTSGAAKYHDLIRAVRPKIIICEEAGEVLEAHILSSLTTSVQHIILIGDHNQLRPKICAYKLSVDSNIGKNYGLDVSLFERLVHGRNSMKVEATQLLTQRRMRGEIADLVRKTIYPNLEDHSKTSYPNVCGVQANVFFINHRHPEDSMKSEFALQSHSNEFEVKMVVEMVKYFVRNGYSKSEQIAVLTPYLGQMMKIRDELRNSFAIVTDERDDDAIFNLQDQREDDDDQSEPTPKYENASIAQKKSLNQQVVLRTIDNYQGEEADIVIISLVRNTMNPNDRGSIGFLKSMNRTNVLLSRARHGMYLLGNAELMENESEMWANVIKILRSRQPSQVNYGFPIVCANHPDYKNVIVDPQKFQEVSPDGGCILDCGQTLICGHVCPQKCHSDDPGHVSVFCKKPCARLRECGHPCKLLCGNNCGECKFPVGDIELPCGHTFANATCHQSHNREKVTCETKIRKKLLKCEHEVTINCHESDDKERCLEICSSQLSECGHLCESLCWQCQEESIGSNNDESQFDEDGHVKRTRHKRCKQVCSKNQFCGHTCKEKCHIDNPCQICEDTCDVSCVHSECKFPCGTPCSVCAKRCNWSCEHKGECNLPCGVPCSRLPCNEHCLKPLECGHKCFGICGEECPSLKFCVKCAPEDVKNQVVDFNTQSTFAEVNWNAELMVFLSCDHVFTAKTLDKLFEMEEFYEVDDHGNWVAVKPIVDRQRGPKCCPICRKPIRNVRRYGRAIKNRILDIQNRKFLATYDSQLECIRKKLENNVINLESNRKKFIEKLNGPLLTRNGRVSKISDEKIPDRRALGENYFKRLEKYYSIPFIHEKLWNEHTKSLLDYYTDVFRIITGTANPPYKLAYDAVISSLNTQSSDGSPTAKSLRLQESLEEVGIITPKIDRRIYLDAFLEMVNIQKVLFHEISSIIDGLTPNRKKIWLTFSKFLIKSTKSHLKLIDKTASETRYTRHSVLALLELVEFECTIRRFELRNPSSGLVNTALQKRIKDKCSKIKNRCSHIRGLLPPMDLDYFKQQCNERIDKVLQDVLKLHIAAESSGKLTEEEKLQIHRTMSGEFHGSDRWYQCPSGHVYTIGGYEKTVKHSRCPDCGSSIGEDQGNVLYMWRELRRSLTQLTQSFEESLLKHIK